ncbi:ABC transporter permease [Paenibacillaceae bacterium]|nr:ABC transporter permease [Paenibacillaceae bacterium]
MNAIVQVAAREIKLGFRNPWAYSFMGLFAVFMLSLLLINSQGYVQGYSGLTGTLLNLILYLLPLMTLMLGSFSLTGEKEDGNWELLSTYSIGTWSFMAGKYVGVAVVLMVIVSLGFGIAGAGGWLTGSGFDLSAYVLLVGFSFSLALLFLAAAMLIGALARNRWQALTFAAGYWFFTIIAWPPLLIAALGMLPNMWIKPAVASLTLLNPAELSRLFAVIKLGGGSVLGPEYYAWIQWIRGPAGTISFIGMILLWIGIATGAANWLWERGRKRA